MIFSRMLGERHIPTLLSIRDYSRSSRIRLRLILNYSIWVISFHRMPIRMFGILALRSLSEINPSRLTCQFQAAKQTFATGSGGITVPIVTTLSPPSMSLTCSPATLVVGSMTSCTAKVGGGATGVVDLSVGGQTIAGLGVDSSGSVTFGLRSP